MAMDAQELESELERLMLLADDAGDNEDVAPRVERVSSLCDGAGPGARALTGSQDATLLAFLDRSTMPERVKVKSLVAARRKCLDFLTAYVERVGELCRDHARSIADACLMVFARDESDPVRSAALHPICALAAVPSVSAAQLDAGRIVERLFRDANSSRSNQTTRGETFRALGVLGKEFPSAMEDKARNLVTTGMSTLQTQLRARDPKLKLVAGILSCFTELLDTFTEGFDGEDAAHAQALYKVVCTQAVVVPAWMRRFDVPRAGLRLFARQAWVFRPWILRDGQDIFTRLLACLTSQHEGVRREAPAAIEALVTEVARAAAQAGPEADESVNGQLSFFLGSLSSVFKRPDSPPDSLHIAVFGLGRLGPCLLRSGQPGVDQLRQLFLLLLATARDLGLTANAGGASGGGGASLPSRLTERRATALAADFLEACAACLHALFSAPAAGVDVEALLDEDATHHLHALARLVLRNYLRLWKYAQATAGRAMAALCLALHPARAAQQALVQEVTGFLLLRTAATASAEEYSSEIMFDPATGLPDPRLLWAYLPLWRDLLHPASPRHTFAALQPCPDAAAVARFHAALHSQLVADFLRVLSSLDLSYRVADGEQGADAAADGSATAQLAAGGADTGALVPSSWADHAVFQNLVAFAQRVLAEGRPALLLRWLPHLCAHITALAHTYPLLSGLYRLLAVALRVGAEHSAFAPRFCRLVATARRAAPETAPPADSGLAQGGQLASAAAHRSAAGAVAVGAESESVPQLAGADASQRRALRCLMSLDLEGSQRAQAHMEEEEEEEEEEVEEATDVSSWRDATTAWLPHKGMASARRAWVRLTSSAGASSADWMMGEAAMQGPCSPDGAALCTALMGTAAADPAAMDRCGRVMARFVREALTRMQQVRDELLAALLQMLLATPSALVPTQALVPALSTALRQGLSHEPSARAAVGAMERWFESRRGDIAPHLPHLLPRLADYLTTVSDEGQAGDDGPARGRRRRKAKGKAGGAASSSSSSSSALTPVQRRVLALLGRAGGEAQHACGDRESLVRRSVAWDATRRVRLELPLGGQKRGIYLDAALTRAVELALTATVRRTKVAACEFVHACVLLLLGLGASGGDAHSRVYRHLFPAVLRLAVDAERVARQLFEPLALQLVRWFSGTRFETKETGTLLDAVSEAVGDPGDGALRAMAARAMAEFLAFAIRQADTRRVGTHAAVTALFRRLHSLARHPSPHKRLGSMQAMSMLHRTFRENASVVDCFAPHAVQSAIESLRLSHDDSDALGAGDAARKAVDEYAAIMLHPRSRTQLLEANENRRACAAGLHEMLPWLLSRCTVPQTECRRRCMALVLRVAAAVRGTGVSGKRAERKAARAWFADSVPLAAVMRAIAGGNAMEGEAASGADDDGVSPLEPPAVGADGDGDEDTRGLGGADTPGDRHCRWLQRLAGAVDFLHWLLTHRLVDAGELFDPSLAAEGGTLTAGSVAGADVLTLLARFFDGLMWVGCDSRHGPAATAATAAIDAAWDGEAHDTRALALTPRERALVSAAKVVALRRGLALVKLMVTPPHAKACLPQLRAHGLLSSRVLCAAGLALVGPDALALPAEGREVQLDLPNVARILIRAFVAKDELAKEWKAGGTALGALLAAPALNLLAAPNAAAASRPDVARLARGYRDLQECGALTAGVIRRVGQAAERDISTQRELGAELGALCARVRDDASPEELAEELALLQLALALGWPAAEEGDAQAATQGRASTGRARTLLRAVLDRTVVALRGGGARSGAEDAPVKNTDRRGAVFFRAFRTEIVRALGSRAAWHVAAPELVQAAAKSGTAATVLHAVVTAQRRGRAAAFLKHLLPQLPALGAFALPEATTAQRRVLAGLLPRIVALDPREVLSHEQVSVLVCRALERLLAAELPLGDKLIAARMLKHVLPGHTTCCTLPASPDSAHPGGDATAQSGPLADVEKTALTMLERGLVVPHMAGASTVAAKRASDASAYGSALRVILELLEWTAHPKLLEWLLRLLKEGDAHTHAAEIDAALARTVYRLPYEGDNPMAVVAACFHHYASPRVAWAAKEALVTKVVVPLLLKSSAAFVVRVFTEAGTIPLPGGSGASDTLLAWLVQDASKLPGELDDDAAVLRKAAAFRLLEVLYECAAPADIKGRVSQAFVGAGTRAEGNELTKKLCKVARSAVVTRAGKGSPEASWRLVCAAYNCLAVVVCRTQTKEQLFTKLLFAEGSRPFWNRLANPELKQPWTVETAFASAQWHLAQLRANLALSSADDAAGGQDAASGGDSDLPAASLAGTGVARRGGVAGLSGASLAVEEVPFGGGRGEDDEDAGGRAGDEGEDEDDGEEEDEVLDPLGVREASKKGRARAGSSSSASSASTGESGAAGAAGEGACAEKGSAPAVASEAQLARQRELLRRLAGAAPASAADRALGSVASASMPGGSMASFGGVGASAALESQASADGGDGGAAAGTVEGVEAEAEEAVYELDELNQNPTMVVLIRVLDQMHAMFGGSWREGGYANAAMPQWMEELYERFTAEPMGAADEAAEVNTKVLLMKVLLNRPRIFAPWARDWVRPLLLLAVRLEREHARERAQEAGGDEEDWIGVRGMHYILRDVCGVLLQWGADSTPGKASTGACSSFINLLVRSCSHVRASVVEHNVALVHSLLEQWQALRLDVDLRPVADMLGATDDTASACAKASDRARRGADGTGGSSRSGMGGDTRTISAAFADQWAGLQLMAALSAAGVRVDKAGRGRQSSDPNAAWSHLVRLCSAKRRKVRRGAAEVASLVLAQVEEEEGQEAAARFPLRAALEAHTLHLQQGAKAEALADTLERASLHHPRVLHSQAMLGCVVQALQQTQAADQRAALLAVARRFLAAGLPSDAGLGAGADRGGAPASDRRASQSTTTPPASQTPSPWSQSLSASFGVSLQPTAMGLLGEDDMERIVPGGVRGAWQLIASVLPGALSSPDADVRGEAYALIRVALPALDAPLLAQVMGESEEPGPLGKTYTVSGPRDDSAACRREFYAAMEWLWDHVGTETAADATALSVRRRAWQCLALGLGDADESVRDAVFAFWDDDARLPPDPRARLLRLMGDFLGDDSAGAWLSSSSRLLLALSKRSADFGRPVFQLAAGGDAVYNPMRVDATWHGADAYTPLFSSQGGPGVGPSQGGGVGLLLATQGPVWTQTQAGLEGQGGAAFAGRLAGWSQALGTQAVGATLSMAPRSGGGAMPPPYALSGSASSGGGSGGGGTQWGAEGRSPSLLVLGRKRMRPGASAHARPAGPTVTGSALATPLGVIMEEEGEEGNENGSVSGGAAGGRGRPPASMLSGTAGSASAAAAPSQEGGPPMCKRRRFGRVSSATGSMGPPSSAGGASSSSFARASQDAASRGLLPPSLTGASASGSQAGAGAGQAAPPPPRPAGGEDRSTFQEKALQQKRASVAKARQFRMAQRKQVRLMRRYREGELPDLRISLRDVLTPLAALCDVDGPVSREVFVLLFQWLALQPAAEEGEEGGADVGADKGAADDVTAALSEALGRALELAGQLRDPSLTGALLAAVDSVGAKELDVHTPTVVEAALAAGTEQAGALVVESRLRHDMDRRLAGGSASQRGGKRGGRRSAEGGAEERAQAMLQAGQPLPIGLRHQYGALAQLYEALGEDDVLRGAVARASVRPGTQRALRSELEGDFAAAVDQYEALITGEEEEEQERGEADAESRPTAAETDLWFTRALECNQLLGRWGTVVDEVATEVLGEGLDAEGGSVPVGHLGRGWDPGSMQALWAVQPPALRTQLARHIVRASMSSAACGDGAASDALHAFFEATLSGDGDREGAGEGGEGSEGGSGAAGKQLSTAGRRAWVARYGAVEAASLRAERLDWDGARELAERARQSFVARWASLHPLSQHARVDALRRLAALSAVEDTLALRDKHPLLGGSATGGGGQGAGAAPSSAVERTAARRALAHTLLRWMHLRPSARDGPPAWQEAFGQLDGCFRAVGAMAGALEAAEGAVDPRKRTQLTVLRTRAHAAFASSRGLLRAGAADQGVLLLQRAVEMRQRAGLHTDVATLDAMVEKSCLACGKPGHAASAPAAALQRLADTAALLTKRGPSAAGGAAHAEAAVAALRGRVHETVLWASAAEGAEEGLAAFGGRAALARDAWRARMEAARLYSQALGVAAVPEAEGDGDEVEGEEEEGAQPPAAKRRRGATRKGATRTGARKGRAAAAARAPDPAPTRAVALAVERHSHWAAGRARLVEAGEAHLRVASFADAALRARSSDSVRDEGTEGHAAVPAGEEALRGAVAGHILRSAALGCSDGADRLPSVLSLLPTSAAARARFQEEAAGVPAWRLLRWASQLVSLVGSVRAGAEAAEREAALLAVRALESVAREYAQPLYFALRVSEASLECAAGEVDLTQLRARVHNPLLDSLVDALYLLHSPHLRWKDHVQALGVAVRRHGAGSREVQKAWAALVRWTADDGDKHLGRLSRECAKAGRAALKKHFEETRADKAPRRLTAQVVDAARRDDSVEKAGRANRREASSLDQYSLWLSQFAAAEHAAAGLVIELPGQCDGVGREPLATERVVVTGFDDSLLVMRSKQQPKRLCMRGNDEADHLFLVKGGEDLRLDQRIEHLFGTMNGVMARDAECRRRGLRVGTYKVVPMTTAVGAIEWLNDTKPLKMVMEEAYQELPEPSTVAATGRGAGARRHVNLMTIPASKHREAALAKHAKNAPKGVSPYLHAYDRMSGEAARTLFRECEGMVREDLLRHKLRCLALGPESYVLLRAHFARAMATLSLCSYLLGVGDRHAENFLVDLGSGAVVPIDFGHAFGSATSLLPVPELLPFRLTPQVQHLLRPLDTLALLKQSMVHALAALSAQRDVLLGIMDLFVSDPLVDWVKPAQEAARLQDVVPGGEEGTNGSALTDASATSSAGQSRKRGRGRGATASSGASSGSELAASADGGGVDSSWYPRRKLELARRKLCKGHPCWIMERELSENARLHTPQRKSVARALWGGEWGALRAEGGTSAEACPDVATQVDYLVDLAVDPAVLARQWIGLVTWV